MIQKPLTPGYARGRLLTRGTQTAAYNAGIYTSALGSGNPVWIDSRGKLGYSRSGSPEQYGLIAEEVDKVAPDLVSRDQDRKIRTVYYDKVNAMLLNEVQKQHRLIEAFEARLAGLEKQKQ